MKRIQSKKHKLETYEIDKIYMLDDGIHTPTYFHKDSVTSCKKIQKDCKEIKKDCDKKDCDKKDCVIIEKDCDKKDCDKEDCGN